MESEAQARTGCPNTDPADAGPPVSLLPLEGPSTFGGVGALSFPTYMHGYGVRVALLLPKADALAALAKVGFPGTNPKNWAGKVIRTMRGTAWLGFRKEIYSIGWRIYPPIPTRLNDEVTTRINSGCPRCSRSCPTSRRGNGRLE